MTARERADRLLVARGFYESRARAQAAIAAGLVTADGVPIRKTSDAISTTAEIEAKPEPPYVSRGGIKLAAALDHFHLDVAGRICLDVGASTGGFSEVLAGGCPGCWRYAAGGASMPSMSAPASFIRALRRAARSYRWSKPTSARSIRRG